MRYVEAYTRRKTGKPSLRNEASAKSCRPVSRASNSAFMPVVAYLSHPFPSPVEPYVVEEIRELRKRGVDVIPCSARRADDTLDDALKQFVAETLYLQPVRIG